MNTCADAIACSFRDVVAACVNTMLEVYDMSSVRSVYMIGCSQREDGMLQG